MRISLHISILELDIVNRKILENMKEIKNYLQPGRDIELFVQTLRKIRKLY